MSAAKSAICFMGDHFLSRVIIHSGILLELCSDGTE
jgi:hypothetical protein